MNNKGKATLVGLVAALAIGAVPSVAMAQGRVREMDLNGDGTVTKDEARSALDNQFKAMDANHDGVLSQDEFVNARLAVLERLDSNGDGQITRDEMRSAFMAARRGR
jgi:hypothetical protein